MGRVEIFRSVLSSIINGHELFIAVAASQIISNVPCAILLSGFTNKLNALIIGTNIGALALLSPPWQALYPTSRYAAATQISKADISHISQPQISLFSL